MARPSASPTATATATRFATYWIVDAIGSDESLNFSVLQALVGAPSELLVGAPEATRERVALQCLQQHVVAAGGGGDATATAGVLRVDGARSCEDVLYRLYKEVGSSGKLEKDLLLPFIPKIQETICTNKLTLPEPSLQLILGMKEDLERMEDVLGAAEAERRPRKMLKVT